MSDVEALLIARQDDANWQRQTISLDALSGVAVVRGLQYWTRLSANRTFPSRKEIIPREIASILRNVLIVRVLEDASEFEYRIAGDVVIQLHGPWLPNATTAEVDSHYPGYGRLIKRVYQQVFRSGLPLALRGAVERMSRASPRVNQLFKHESIFLPLGESGGPVDHIFVVCEVIS